MTNEIIKTVLASKVGHLNQHLADLETKQPGKNKYGARKVVIDGITFASTKEGGRYMELKMMERARIISKLELQPVYLLIPKATGQRECKYKADFRYIRDGVEIVEDVKGFKSQVFRLKQKLMKERLGIEILIT